MSAGEIAEARILTRSSPVPGVGLSTSEMESEVDEPSFATLTAFIFALMLGPLLSSCVDWKAGSEVEERERSKGQGTLFSENLHNHRRYYILTSHCSVAMPGIIAS